MKASSESGLWAQTMSLTGEIVIGEEHTITSQGLTAPSLGEALEDWLQLFEVRQKLRQRGAGLVQLAPAANYFKAMRGLRGRERTKIGNRSLQGVSSALQPFCLTRNHRFLDLANQGGALGQEDRSDIAEQILISPDSVQHGL